MMKNIYIISANFEHILKIHVFAFKHVSDLALRLIHNSPHSAPHWELRACLG